MQNVTRRTPLAAAAAALMAPPRILCETTHAAEVTFEIYKVKKTGTFRWRLKAARCAAVVRRIPNVQRIIN